MGKTFVSQENAWIFKDAFIVHFNMFNESSRFVNGQFNTFYVGKYCEVNLISLWNQFFNETYIVLINK